MKVMLFWNIIVFAVYGLDKFYAVKGKWRISEKNLLLFAFFMGGFGAFLGMQIFRHKIRKMTFSIGVPLAMLLNVVVIYIVEKVLL